MRVKMMDRIVEIVIIPVKIGMIPMRVSTPAVFCNQVTMKGEQNMPMLKTA